jgi:ActR/RegA family two-component response regulator
VRVSKCLLWPVVDDSMLIRYTVCRFLEERGFQVESATNGDAPAATKKKSAPTSRFTKTSTFKNSSKKRWTW